MVRRKKAAPGAVAEKGADYTEIVGKDFYRAETVNEGHYSKKRADVADVDPKVTSIVLFLTLMFYLSRLWSRSSPSQASHPARSSLTVSASCLLRLISRSSFLNS